MSIPCGKLKIYVRPSCDIREVTRSHPKGDDNIEFYLGKRMNKIEYEGISTCARNEVSQDADDADQKSKIVSGSSENIQPFVGSIFSIFFFPKFLFRFIFYKCFDFHPLKMKVKQRN